MSIQSKGLVNFADDYVNYSAKLKYNTKKQTTQFDNQFNLTPLEVHIKQINYTD